MDNTYPRMLCRFPASGVNATPLQDGAYDTAFVVSADEQAEAEAEGFCTSPGEARAAHEAKVKADAEAKAIAEKLADAAPATREELEAKATELGIQFKGTWGDKKLAEAIAEKLAA